MTDLDTTEKVTLDHQETEETTMAHPETEEGHHVPFQDQGKGDIVTVVTHDRTPEDE